MAVLQVQVAQQQQQEVRRPLTSALHKHQHPMSNKPNARTKSTTMKNAITPQVNLELLTQVMGQSRRKVTRRSRDKCRAKFCGSKIKV